MEFEEQAYLNYYGRIIYNYGIIISIDQFPLDVATIKIGQDGNNEKFYVDGKEVYINETTNVFRNDLTSLPAQVIRCFSFDCENISQAIFAKKIVDRSILSEIIRKNISYDILYCPFGKIYIIFIKWSNI